MQTSYETILHTMQEVYTQSTGQTPDDAADVGIRFQAVAAVLAQSCQWVNRLRQDMLPQTSCGPALERHALLRGLFREEAKPAKGLLRFSRSQPALQDIAIPAGTHCTTTGAAPILFATTQAGMLPAGELDVEVPAQAAAAGTAGNTAAGRITLLLSPPVGISAVTNPAPFSGGCETESDDNLRRRVLSALGVGSNGSNLAHYTKLALACPGVAYAKAFPLRRGVGTLDVLVTFAPQGDGRALLQQLQQVFDQKRELGVDVLVEPAGTTAVDVSGEIRIQAGFQPESVLEQCHKAAQQVFHQLKIGESLYVSRLIQALLAVPGVASASLFSPQKDVLALPTHRLVADLVTLAQKEDA